MIVLDERITPSMRETLSALMSTSTHVDMAVANMRLAGIDVRPAEVTRLQRLRLVIGRLDADALIQTQTRPLDQLRRLYALTTSGILEVRTVPRFKWTPDFSVFDSAALIGAHYTELPYPADGVALTCVIREDAGVRRCARRFEEMWQLGYDVLPVVVQTLHELLGEAAA